MSSTWWKSQTSPTTLVRAMKRGKTGFTRIPGLPRSVTTEIPSLSERACPVISPHSSSESAGLVGQSRVSNYPRDLARKSEYMCYSTLHATQLLRPDTLRLPTIAELPEDPVELLCAELDRAKQTGTSRPLMRTAAEMRVLWEGSPTVPLR